MRALGAVGVIGDEGFLGQDVETGKEPESLVEVEVVDVAAAFFVEEFQDQQTQQSPGGGDHFRAGIAGIVNEAVKAELGQQRQKQENAGDARAQATIIGQRQRAAIGDGRDFGPRCGVVGAGPARSSARRCNEKGGTRSAWQRPRNWETRLRSVPWAKANFQSREC